MPEGEAAMRTGRILTMLVVTATIPLPSMLFAGQDQGTDRGSVNQRVQREQERFRSWDTNGDSVLDRREWRGSAREFRQLDINRDGELSGTEIWVQPSNQGSSEEAQRRDALLEAFSRADRNGDNRLSPTEWWNDRASFNRIDVNRDGLLTPGEFLSTTEAINVPAPAPATDDTSIRTRAYRSGHERGLVEGRQAGKEDKELRNQWDLEGQRELEQADSGYTNDLGRRDEYQAGYRAGFRLGYKQGFGPR